MLYRLLADFVLVLHLSFVLFAIFGGLLVWRWHWIWRIHIPAFIWGVLVQFFYWICPLTTLENYFRKQGGEAGYHGGFIEYYVNGLLYPATPPEFHLLLGILLIVFNLFVYLYLFRKTRLLP